MRLGWTMAAAAVLIAIGAFEGTVSARQLETVAGRPQLGPSGLLLSAAGLAASAAVYLALGRASSTERAAIRAGALAGLVAGLAGGTVRALILEDAVASVVARFAAVPEWFVPVALGVFVLFALVASVCGGAALAWTGRRVGGRGPRSASDRERQG